jgi:hypothetical protein
VYSVGGTYKDEKMHGYNGNDAVLKCWWEYSWLIRETKYIVVFIA